MKLLKAITLLLILAGTSACSTTGMSNFAQGLNQLNNQMNHQRQRDILFQQQINQAQQPQQIQVNFERCNETCRRMRGY